MYCEPSGCEGGDSSIKRAAGSCITGITYTGSGTGKRKKTTVTVYENEKWATSL